MTDQKYSPFDPSEETSIYAIARHGATNKMCDFIVELMRGRLKFTTGELLDAGIKYAREKNQRFDPCWRDAFIQLFGDPVFSDYETNEWPSDIQFTVLDEQCAGPIGQRVIPDPVTIKISQAELVRMISARHTIAAAVTRGGIDPRAVIAGTYGMSLRAAIKAFKTRKYRSQIKDPRAFGPL